LVAPVCASLSCIAVLAPAIAALDLTVAVDLSDVVHAQVVAADSEQSTGLLAVNAVAVSPVLVVN
jgi:hypothetical protein